MKSVVFTFGGMLFLRRWNIAPTCISGRIAFLFILMAGSIIHFWWKGVLLSAFAVSITDVRVPSDFKKFNSGNGKMG